MGISLYPPPAAPVDDTGWILMTPLSNGWKHYNEVSTGSSWPKGHYRRKEGTVYLSGLLSPPATGQSSIIFYLPEGFRITGLGPQIFFGSGINDIAKVTGNPNNSVTNHTHNYSINEGGARIDIYPDGAVRHTGDVTQHLSLAGISFLAEG
ncbi:hypothetical protein SEA_YOSIF_24 [Streptomyces phage Yosif]|uniref:Uncharacterized protein n=1 Tax=Streptomyces phage Yosif TaxID=2201421 RepID=A0A2Z4QCA0_9CAUD|nr:hypothetical protein KGG71_gp24 [Streptomyces phage Yosif]AWY07588.1 hypothetical protein SEA_YOSIF_24 [Streptomyces phage Yosif]